MKRKPLPVSASDLELAHFLLRMYYHNRVAVVDEADGELKVYTMRQYVMERMKEERRKD